MSRLFLLLALFVLFPSDVLAAKPSARSVQAQGKELKAAHTRGVGFTSALGFKEYRDETIGIYVEYPEGWRWYRSGGQESTMFIHTSAEFSGILDVGYTNDGRSMGGWIRRGHDSHVPIDQEDMREVKSMGVIRGTWEGYESVHETIMGIIGSEKVTIETLRFIKGNKIYFLRFQAPTDSFEKERKIVDHFFSSFKITKTDLLKARTKPSSSSAKVKAVRTTRDERLAKRQANKR